MKLQLMKSRRTTLLNRVLRPTLALLPLVVGMTAYGAAVEEPVLIDFGRHDGGNGAATTNPDVNGHYWNSWSPGAGTVAANTVLASTITISNNPSTVTVTTTTAWSNNGYLNGGLTTPDPALLGDFAVGTATGDYFFVQNTSGSLRIGGLDPARQYNLRLYGVRITDASTTRTTRYTVVDASGTHQADLQTSGPGAGSAAVPYGNDRNIVVLDHLTPSAAGQLNLNVTIVNGGFAYIGIMEVVPLGSNLSFIQNPQSMEVAPGTSTSLVASASSPAPINYQWYFKNSPISGANSSSLSLPSVSTNNVGSYFVTASNTYGMITSAVATVTVGPAHLSGFSVLVDFGRNDGGVNGIETANPDKNGHYWNNIGPSTITVPQGIALDGLVTISNAPTSIGITTLDGNFQCNGTQNGGLLNPHYALLGDYAVGTATEDYFFVNNGTPGITGTLRIYGLDPNATYKLKMFATRDVAETRTTRYSVTDVNGLHSVTLQTSGAGTGSMLYGITNGNDHTVVSLNGLVPDASGNVDLSVSEVAGLYAYLGILEITYADQAPAFVLNPQSLEVPIGASTSLVAYAISPQPLKYQWYFQNSPVSGATSTNLPLLNIASANAGSYFLVASNVLGVSTSAVANVTVGPAHLPASAVLIDFSRNDGNNGHDTVSPDVRGTYWNNFATATGTVPQGMSVQNLVTVNNTSTPLGVTILSANFQNNGRNNGGLLSPPYALLGDLAINTATEDYFFLNDGTSGITGSMAITGLDPAKKYDLSMFATRNTDASTTRTTMYSVTDVNGLHSVNLQTSGPGAGSANYPYGNDGTIVSLRGLVPSESGELDLSVTEVNGLFAYIGILEIAPSAQASFTASTRIPGGWQLHFTATPGYTVRVERAATVTGPWNQIGTVLVPDNGVSTFDDTNAPTAQAYYRIVTR
jgi:Immunoglobulin domain